jgi:hypothetical protein
LFVDAYNQSVINKSIQLDWGENDITSQLHEYIDNNPLREKWSISSNVEHHLPNSFLKKRKGFSNKDLRIDLRMVTFSLDEEYKIFFETKNLKEKDSKLKRRYIDTGIGNFITRKYPLGFLVGYLLEGTVSSTIDGINNLLRKDNREKERLYPQKHEIVQYYFQSNHLDMCLKHLIFDFTV